MMLTHCGNNVRNRYSGCVFSVKDIVPVPLKTSRNRYLSSYDFSTYTFYKGVSWTGGRGITLPGCMPFMNF